MVSLVLSTLSHDWCGLIILQFQVWADDQWLVEHAGATLDNKDNDSELADANTENVVPAAIEETQNVSGGSHCFEGSV